MPIKLKILVILIILIILIYMFFLIKRRKVLLKYSLMWIVTCMLIIFVTIFSTQVYKITKIIGIENLSNLMFFIAFVFLFLTSFSLSMILSDQKQKIINLTQEIAILKNKIENKILDKK